MKRAIFSCAFVLAGLAATADAQVRADRCGALNARPAPIGSEFGTGLSIQDAVDAMLWSGPALNCSTMQVRHAAFRPGRDLTVLFTYAGGRFFGENNFLGVYEISDPSNKVPVFIGEDLLRGDQVLMTFLPNGDVLRDGQLVGQNFSSCFGIYMDIYGGTPLSGGSGNPAVLDWVHYSEDALCMNALPQMLMYRGHGLRYLSVPGAPNLDPWLFEPNEFLVGVEAQPLDPGPGLLPADRDYNEAVFVMQGVKTVKRQMGFQGF